MSDRLEALGLHFGADNDDTDDDDAALLSLPPPSEDIIRLKGNIALLTQSQQK
jgi:hypothetical protein